MCFFIKEYDEVHFICTLNGSMNLRDNDGASQANRKSR